MRALVYLRQSLDRAGNNAAVDRQREDCLRLCADRGWEVARVFTDNDVSASSAKPRPAYTDMLAAIERREGEVVVAWHIDRLTRKVTDLEHLIVLTETTGVRITTVTGDIDLSTDSGRLVGRILASVARGEVERKGARQVRAQQQAAEQGRPAGGRRAFGYTRDGLVIVPDEGAVVTRAYADLLKGASLKGIARQWNEAGFTTTAGNPWRHDNVGGVLRNARYAGLRTYRGTVVGPAVWPALVDRDTHAAVQAVLSAPTRRTTTTTARRYLLPGLALCWRCGSDVATGRTRHGKRIYVCRARKCVSRKAEEVDVLVESLVVARLGKLDVADLVSPANGIVVADLQRDRAGVLSRLDELAVSLENGWLNLAAVEQSSARLRAELSRIEDRLRAEVEVDVLRPVIAAGDVVEAWARLDLHQQRQVIESLMTVTLLKPERGTRKFDPRSVGVAWVGVAWKV